MENDQRGQKMESGADRSKTDDEFVDVVEELKEIQALEGFKAARNPIINANLKGKKSSLVARLVSSGLNLLLQKALKSDGANMPNEPTEYKPTGPHLRAKQDNEGRIDTKLQVANIKIKKASAARDSSKKEGSGDDLEGFDDIDDLKGDELEKEGAKNRQEESSTAPQIDFEKQAEEKGKCMFSMCTTGKNKPFVVFNTATDNGIRYGGDAPPMAAATMTDLPWLEDVFECIKKDDTFKAKIQHANFPMHVLIPISSDWKSAFSPHAHFRLLDLTLNKEGENIKVNQATLIDSRSGSIAKVINTPWSDIQKKIAAEFPDCTFKTVYTGHQERTNTTTCGYYAADYAVQIAQGIASSQLADRLMLSSSSLGWFSSRKSVATPTSSDEKKSSPPTPTPL